MIARARPWLLGSAMLLVSGVASAEPQAGPTAIVPLGPPAWIGVTMDAGGDTGVRVEHVVRGGPADRAGMKVGDRIVAIDGARVTQPAQVSRNVTSRKAGETITLSLERTGNPIRASIVLASRPSGDEILRMDLVGAPAPAWVNVAPLAGAPSSLAALRGRVVVVDFWASWCGPCRMLAPRLSTLKNRFGAQGLSVVGVTTDDAEQAALFAERHRMTYPSVVDKDGDTNKSWGIVGLPTVVVVDKKGVVREVFVGYDPSGDAKMEQVVKTLLAEPAPKDAAAGSVPPPAVPRPDPR
jgi:thiol-disulfide isomerase/thioredoxin